jgi:hypothetical protein
MVFNFSLNCVLLFSQQHMGLLISWKYKQILISC